jgi:hypothetical protein
MPSTAGKYLDQFLAVDGTGSPSERERGPYHRHPSQVVCRRCALTTERPAESIEMRTCRRTNASDMDGPSRDAGADALPIECIEKSALNMGAGVGPTALLVETLSSHYMSRLELHRTHAVVCEFFRDRSSAPSIIACARNLGEKTPFSVLVLRRQRGSQSPHENRHCSACGGANGRRG